jgi:hypothetical protein
VGFWLAPYYLLPTPTATPPTLTLTPAIFMHLATTGFLPAFLPRSSPNVLTAMAMVHTHTYTHTQGMKYHPYTLDYAPEVQYKLVLVVDDVPMNKLLDSSFWFMLLRIQVWPNDNHSAALLYETLLPYLSAKPLSAVVYDNLVVGSGSDEKKPPPPPGPPPASAFGVEPKPDAAGSKGGVVSVFDEAKGRYAVGTLGNGDDMVPWTTLPKAGDGSLIHCVMAAANFVMLR